MSWTTGGDRAVIFPLTFHFLPHHRAQQSNSTTVTCVQWCTVGASDFRLIRNNVFFGVGLCFSRPWVNRRLFSLAQTHSAYSLPTAASLTPVCDRLYHIYILSIRRLSKQSYCSSCPSPRSAASVHFITAPSEVCGFLVCFFWRSNWPSNFFSLIFYFLFFEQKISHDGNGYNLATRAKVMTQ